MDIKARFTLIYSLTVLVITSGIFVFASYLLVEKTAGWTFAAGTLTITHHAAVLALLSPLMLAVFGTQLGELFARKDVLVVTRRGIHDRRLTRGEVLWDQIAYIHLYRKGWQMMALIEPKVLTARPDNMRLGPMPLYAFNRLCARWQKRPELNIGLGGMTTSSDTLIQAIATRYAGQITREP